MKVQSWLVLGVVLTGCPVFELPSPDGGIEGMGSQNADCTNGECGDDDGRVGGDMGGAAGSASNEGFAGSGPIAADAGMAEPLPNPPRTDLGDGSVGEFQATLDQFYAALCSCTGQPIDQCTSTTAEERACDQRALQEHADVAGPWLACVTDFLREQTECVRASACRPESLLSCQIVAQSDSSDPFVAACGEAPAELDAASEACGHDEDPQPVSFPCWSGGEVPAEWVCDGAPDCTDGSDEMVCGGIEEGFACGDGEFVPESWQCDGEPDCANGSDEVDCGDRLFDCGDGDFIPSAWVCDGEGDCLNDSDEATCSSSF